MFSDTVFMDSMLPAHRLNPLQVKNIATANRGRGGVVEHLDTVVPAQIQKKVQRAEQVLTATASRRPHHHHCRLRLTVR